MDVFSDSSFDHHEQLSFFADRETGLRAIVAIHDRTLGPALGGCRMWPYEDEAHALRDVLRLSRGMTFKAALAGVALGGGKSVIIGDAKTAKTPKLMHAMGRAIDALGGQYITGEDVGTNPDDMREIRTQTRFVTCLRKEDGGPGDPAPLTALGVFSAIRAGLRFTSGTDDLNGVHVAVQGVGNVGYRLCALLRNAGASLTVCDAHAPAAQRVAADFGAQVVAQDAIYDVNAMVFSPCALGGVLGEATIARLKARVVGGAANNQLVDDASGRALLARGITYLPDYVANGGGLIGCDAEWYGHGEDKVLERVRGIFDTCTEILERARSDRVATNEAADAIGRARLAAAKGSPVAG